MRLGEGLRFDHLGARRGQGGLGRRRRRPHRRRGHDDTGKAPARLAATAGSRRAERPRATGRQRELRDELRELEGAHRLALPEQELLQVRLHLPAALVTLLAVLGQRPLDDALQVLGHVGTPDGYGREGRVEDRVHQRDLAAGLEGLTPRHQFVQHDPERVDVTAQVERLVPELLGRHVGHLPLERANLGLVHLIARLGDAEVHDLHGPRSRQEDVVGADVPVHQAQRLTGVGVGELVRVGEPLADGGDELRAVGQWQRPAHRMGPAHQRAEVGAIDVLHGQEVHAVRLAEIEDLDDVGMVELGGESGLGQEHLDELGLVDQMREDLLHHQGLLEPHGPRHTRPVDLGHTAMPKLSKQLVPAHPRAVRNTVSGVQHLLPRRQN